MGLLDCRSVDVAGERRARDRALDPEQTLVGVAPEHGAEIDHPTQHAPHADRTPDRWRVLGRDQGAPPKPLDPRGRRSRTGGGRGIGMKRAQGARLGPAGLLGRVLARELGPALGQGRVDLRGGEPQVGNPPRRHEPVGCVDPAEQGQERPGAHGARRERHLGCAIGQEGRPGSEGVTEIGRQRLDALRPLALQVLDLPDRRRDHAVPPFFHPPPAGGPDPRRGGKRAQDLRIGRVVRRADQVVDAIDDRHLDPIEAIARDIRAGPALSGGRAGYPHCVAAPVVDRHAATALTTNNQAREWPQPAPLPPARAVSMRPRRLAGEHGGACRRVNNSEMRRFATVVRLRRGRAAEPSAGIGIADHGDAPPDDRAPVQRVHKYPVPPCRVAVDRARAPDPPTRRRDAIRVEPLGDLARGQAVDIFGVNPADDLRLGLDDLQLARFAGHGAVAVSPPAGVASLAHDPLHPPPHLVLEVGEEQLSEQAADADLDRVGAALVHRVDLDAGKPQPFVDPGEVLLVAADPVERLDHDAGKPSRAGILHQGQQAVAADDRGGRLRAVAVDVGDRQSVVGSVSPA